MTLLRHDTDGETARGVAELARRPHRRYNPLTGDWVLVSPQRTKRPWQGRTERTAPEHLPTYDAECYLCPGNARANSAVNPRYTGPFAFDNDFPALRRDEAALELDVSGLLQARSESGVCRVVCYSPRHDLSLAELDHGAVRAVVDLWTHEFEALGARADVNHVQIFENRGEAMGCSNPHPHGQIWAQSAVPRETGRETKHLGRYYARQNRSLLADYVELESRLGDRIVCENDDFVALVPFWAVWPFETLLVPRRQVHNLSGLHADERDALADVLKRLTTRYDNLFETPFPYSMGIHQAPTDGYAHPEWHLHLHVYPPLLRSATVRKFMVGYEMMAEPQRDLTAEESAERLRALSETHYRERACAAARG